MRYVHYRYTKDASLLRSLQQRIFPARSADRRLWLVRLLSLIYYVPAPAELVLIPLRADELTARQNTIAFDRREEEYAAN